MTKTLTPYQQKLLDPRWQKKRLEILNRDEFTCQYCEDSENTLHIHHLAYHKNPWDISNDKLITCCEQCHEEIESFKKDGYEVLKIKVFRKKHVTIREIYSINKGEYFICVYTVDNVGKKSLGINTIESVLENQLSTIKLIRDAKN